MIGLWLGLAAENRNTDRSPRLKSIGDDYSVIVMNKPSLKVSGVYCLKDPETGLVRYVGQSKNIHNRYYNGHLHAQKKTGHPVSMWTNKLKESGLKPVIEILELHESPEDIESDWIEKMRGQGCDLLNIHAGGRMPSAIGNGVTTKIWSVSGMVTPWLFLCKTLYPQRGNDMVSSSLKLMKEERASRKSEEGLLRFELDCAKFLLDNFHKSSKQVAFVEKWLLKVAGRINKKYPGMLVVMSCDGVRVA